MKKSRLLPFLSVLLLPSCAGLPGNFTLGYTGRAQDGSNYVIGLNLPLGSAKPAAEPVPVEAAK